MASAADEEIKMPSKKPSTMLTGFENDDLEGRGGGRIEVDIPPPDERQKRNPTQLRLTPRTQQKMQQTPGGMKLISGYVQKQGSWKRNWRRRWLILYGDRQFSYYTDDTLSELRGRGSFQNLSRVEEHEHRLKIYTADRTWVFKFDSDSERNIWKEYIQHGRLKSKSIEQIMRENEGYEKSNKRLKHLIKEKVRDNREKDKLIQKFKEQIENGADEVDEFSRQISVDNMRSAELEYEVEKIQQEKDAMEEKFELLATEKEKNETAYQDKLAIVEQKIESERHVMQEAIRNLETELERVHESHRKEISEIEETQNQFISEMKEKHEKELDKQALDFEAELNQYQEELSQKELNFQQTHEELTKRHSEIRSELVKAQLSSEKDLENMEEEKIRTIEEIKEQTKRDMEMIKENQKRETVLLEQKIQEETRQVMEAQKFEFEQEKRKLLNEKQVLETTLINKINTITELNQQEKEEEHKKIPSLSSDTQMWLNWFFFNIDDPKLEQFVSESEEAQRLVYTLGTKVATRSTNEFQKDMDEIEKRNKLIANSIKPVLMQLGIKGGDLRSAKDVHKLVRAFPLLQKQLTDYQERVRELEMELRLAKRKGQVSKWHVEQKHFIRN